jgi:hypothetical protein
MENCEHEKVYADYALYSNPPQVPWTCIKCGEKGKDVYNAYEIKFIP